MADPLPRPSTPRAPYTFDVATGVVAAGDGAWTATIDPGWGIGDRPNGGYLLALAARAALAASGPGETAHPDPLAVSAHFLTAPAAGPAELPGGIRVPILNHLDVRLDPATAGWAVGRPAGRLEMRGWVRFHDGRPPDPLALLQVVDALPPASFELGIAAWAPTVELTAYVRRPPAAGWLRCVVRGSLVQGGWFDEEAEVWDARDALVAQARQLAGARAPVPPAR